MKQKIKKILQEIDRNKRVDIQGKERIAWVLKNQEVDFLPLIFGKPHNKTVPGKTYNMEEQFYNKEKMFYGHLEEIVDCAPSTFDAQLCLRPNFGTIFIPSMFGLE